MDKIAGRLLAMRDEAYGDFSARLVPTVERNRIIGVRMPALRAYARELAKTEDFSAFLAALPHFYLEENHLHGALLSLCFRDIDGLLEKIDEFLPYVDNWSVCDSLSPKLLGKYPDKVYERITGSWLRSAHTYTVRFAIVTLMGFYLDEGFRPEAMHLITALPDGDYYIDMAAAWYFSFALIKQYEAAVPLFEAGLPSKWVHNKSIQKAIESRRISGERKAYLRSLKRK